MGDRDSSITRVAPVFTTLLMRDPTGLTWLPELLKLPERQGAADDRPASRSALRRCGWWPAEVRLPPPPSLLEYLIENTPSGVVDSLPERIRLAGRDEETLKQAQALLRSRASTSLERAWYVLEGPTSVDAYLETDDLVVVIEGKRTEAGPTTRTKWMPVRHQMLRNIDAAWEIRGRRNVVGFFIVEGKTDGGLSEAWNLSCAATVEEKALDGSLPHRDYETRRAISDAFLGATTWQRLCRVFSITGRPFDRVILSYET
jgi:hypothetical protein